MQQSNPEIFQPVTEHIHVHDNRGVLRMHCHVHGFPRILRPLWNCRSPLAVFRALRVYALL